jgi:hypothetical protein
MAGTSLVGDMEPYAEAASVLGKMFIMPISVSCVSILYSKTDCLELWWWPAARPWIPSVMLLALDTRDCASKVETCIVRPLR